MVTINQPLGNNPKEWNLSAQTMKGKEHEYKLTLEVIPLKILELTSAFNSSFDFSHTHLK